MGKTETEKTGKTGGTGGIEMIPIGRLREHPDNPRKDRGDLTELTESVRKNGVMQNLTVVPDPEGDGYLVLIGNRRYAAALAAGLTELPCRIEGDIPKGEQVALMLAENIQRNDLTVLEQADGFQLMLDLGETVETVAEKTGFSKSTVRHRLNIAKLDHELIEGFADDGFQLTLNDLYELEKIPDVGKRNDILRKARSSAEILARVRTELDRIEKDRLAEEAVRMLERSLPGITPIPKEEESKIWRNYVQIGRIPLMDPIPDEPPIKPEDAEGAEGGEIRYHRPEYVNAVLIMRKRPEKGSGPTERELEEMRREENRQKAAAIVKNVAQQRDSFVRNIIKGVISGPGRKEEESVKESIWKAILLDGEEMQCFRARCIYEYLSDETYKKKMNELAGHELTEVEAAAERMPVLQQMLICMADMAGRHSPVGWDGAYRKGSGAVIMACDSILERWGWYYGRAEREVIDGSSGLYVKDGES